MKVAIVHDDLVQWGGAERVLTAISEIYPYAPIYTSVFDSSNKLLMMHFKDKTIITSFLQKIPGWKSFYKGLLPLYPIVFEQFDFSQYDLVISQTTRFAKSVITKPGTTHVCVCHTPPRFLWNFSRTNPPAMIKPYLSLLRIQDRISAKRVDYWIAGSYNCQQRLKKIYNVSSVVLQPFVDTSSLAKESFYGGYYLVITRLNSYKNVNVAIEAFNKSGKKLKIVGVGPQFSELNQIAKDNIELLGSVSEYLLQNLLQGCQALIVTADEDFGMTSLEAQMVGKPVIAYGRGGSLETILENKTGLFFNELNSGSLNQAIEKLEGLKINARDCIENAHKFSKTRFQDQLKQMIKTALS